MALLVAFPMAWAGGMAIAQTPTSTTTPTIPPAISPTTSPAVRSEAEMAQSLRALNLSVNQLIGDDSELADPVKRQAIAVQAVPLLRRLKIQFDELATVNPQMARQSKALHLQVDQTLAILGDADGARSLDAMAASDDPAESLAGQGSRLMVRWVTAGKDESARAKVVDEIDALDRAHPDSIGLTVVTDDMAKSATSPALTARLNKLTTEVMNNPAVAAVKMRLDLEARNEKLKQMVGRPFVVAAKTVEGKNFTTADWAGKVVLVDFWATWCGPCKAELPNVQKLYNEQHANGLEIVGVSNDFSATALQSFVAKAAMPWPELFDATAAEQQQWNATTFGYGINKIPYMLVIDKKGVLRSADAWNDYAALVTKLLAE